MHNELVSKKGKTAWKRPAVTCIDIKRTMASKGGSLSDSAFNTPPNSKTSTN